MSEQIIVFGIFFDERAKKEYGSLTNLVRHTFTRHFDAIKKDEYNQLETGHTGGAVGHQTIKVDPSIMLYWRNYRPSAPDGTGADELFFKVAFDRFLSDNRSIYKNDAYMSILINFKDHVLDMIKERDGKRLPGRDKPNK